MTKYELINPSQILDDIQREIELGILGSSQDMLCIKYWKNVHDCLSSKQYKQHISWKNIERFESVTTKQYFYYLIFPRDSCPRTSSLIYTSLIEKGVSTTW